MLLVITFLDIYVDIKLKIVVTVSALNNMYQYLKPSSKLDGWKKDGGDPCGDDSWQGIKCSGSDVTEMYCFPFLPFNFCHFIYYY